VAIAVPAIEIADQECAQRKWRPFSVFDGVVRRDKEPILFVTFGKVRQTAFGFVDRLDPILSLGEARTERGFERLEVWVELENA
jgi:hypothetical protein